MFIATIRLRFWLALNDRVARHTFAARLALIHAEDAARARYNQ